MSWAKLDDGMPDHRKVEGLSAEAFRTFVKAICYSARNLTDGVLPPSCFAYLGRRRYIDELLDASLLEDVDGRSIAVHDYLDFNPSREEVLAERARKIGQRTAAGKSRAAGAQRVGGRFAPAGDQRAAGDSAEGRRPAPIPFPSDLPVPTEPPDQDHTQTRARPKRITEVDEGFRIEMAERFKDCASPERVNAEIDDALGHKAAEKRNDKRAYVRVWLTRARWGDERAIAGGASTAGGRVNGRSPGPRGLARSGAGRDPAAASEYDHDW